MNKRLFYGRYQPMKYYFVWNDRWIEVEVMRNGYVWARSVTERANPRLLWPIHFQEEVRSTRTTAPLNRIGVVE